MYKAREHTDILQELQTLTGSALSKIEGSFTYDVLSSNALEFTKLELELAAAYKNMFGHTCENEYLDLKAEEFGIIRKPANKAIGTVTVIGNGVVYKDSVFATSSNIRFVATETVEVEDGAEVAIAAVEPGKSGNVPAGAINRIPMNIPGIKNVSNASGTYDGYDEESDDELRERFLLKVRYPAASGSPAQYREWALAVVGVGAVRVWRCWQGAGTVKVIIIDSNFEAANVELINRVTAAIEKERPVGAIVTVCSAQIVNIDIACAVVGDFDAERFRTDCNAYFVKLINDSLFANTGAFDEFEKLPEVSIARINALLVAAGADDVLNLTLNAQNANIPLSLDEIPRIGALAIGGEQY